LKPKRPIQKIVHSDLESQTYTLHSDPLQVSARVESPAPIKDAEGLQRKAAF